MENAKPISDGKLCQIPKHDITPADYLAMRGRYREDFCKLAANALRLFKEAKIALVKLDGHYGAHAGEARMCADDILETMTTITRLENIARAAKGFADTQDGGKCST